MSRTANQFVNPRNGATYSWPINHDEEEEFGKSRNIEHTAPTASTGLVKQQGDESPLILRLNGKILEEAQLTAMKGWWSLCATQTIYFYDFAADHYEVIITAFRPKRKRTVRNPRGGTANPLHYWEYTIEMEVIRVLAGPWTGVSP